MNEIIEESNGVIHITYPDGKPYNFRCRHIYEYVGSDICPYCNKPTHEIDMKLQAELYKQHYAEGKHLKYKCDHCGGTLRVWWDI